MHRLAYTIRVFLTTHGMKKDSEDVQRIRKMYKRFAVSNGASCGNFDVRLFQHSSLTDGVYSVSHVMQSRLYVGLCQDFKGCGEPMLSSMIRFLAEVFNDL